MSVRNVNDGGVEAAAGREKMEEEMVERLGEGGVTRGERSKDLLLGSVWQQCEPEHGLRVSAVGCAGCGQVVCGQSLEVLGHEMRCELQPFVQALVVYRVCYLHVPSISRVYTLRQILSGCLCLAARPGAAPGRNHRRTDASAAVKLKW